MNAEAYNLHCVLLAAGQQPGFDGADEARVAAGPDRSGLRLCCWLSDDEMSADRPWRSRGLPVPRALRILSLDTGAVRIGERPAWTDPPGL